MDETVRICEVENESEANLICSVLDDKRIPYVLKTMRDSAYDGLYIAQGPWGFLEAPASYSKSIDQIVRDLRETRAGSNRRRSVERRKGVRVSLIVVPILLTILLFFILIAALHWSGHL